MSDELSTTSEPLQSSDGGSELPMKPLVKALVALLVLIVVAGGIWILTVSSGGGGAKDTARKIIDSMQAGEFAAVQALCTPDANFDDMRREMKRMPDWGTLQNAPLTARRVSEDKYDVGGNIEFSVVRKLFQATLVKQSDGTYRASSVEYK